MATLTVPFCLEMLTFGHQESSGALQSFLDAGRAYGHSHSAFLLGNAYIWPPRELRSTSVIPRRGEGLWPLSQCLFGWKCLHLATQRARGTSETQLGGTLSFRTRGGPMATRTVPFCLEMLTFGHPESSGALQSFLDAERAYGHSHSAFLFGNAYIWSPRELGALA